MDNPMMPQGSSGLGNTGTYKPVTPELARSFFSSSAASRRESLSSAQRRKNLRAWTNVRPANIPGICPTTWGTSHSIPLSVARSTTTVRRRWC